jgi:hypothetical protein
VAIAANADAEVKGAYPTKNYGLVTSLRVRGDAADVHTSYLTFTVPALAKPVASAALRLHVVDGSQNAGWVYLVAPYGETTVTYANGPAVGATKVGTLGAVTTGSWANVPLSGSFAPGQVLTIAVASTSSDSAIFDSRESVAGPNLVLTLIP